eukprot:4399863-Pyramimonas_sp.AAC.1
MRARAAYAARRATVQYGQCAPPHGRAPPTARQCGPGEHAPRTRHPAGQYGQYGQYESCERAPRTRRARRQCGQYGPRERAPRTRHPAGQYG